jgi:hypothetical protein
MKYICSECKCEKSKDRVSARVLAGKRRFTTCLDCQATNARNYRAMNKMRFRSVQKEYYHLNKDKARNRSLKSKYGITLEEWNTVFNAQNESCAICFTKSPGGRGWQTDHNHNSGKFRAILCHNCNSLLGYARENPETLLEAFHYLCKHSGHTEGFLTERKYVN